MSALSFEILKQDKETHARLGLIKTRRGDIETPYLVPVATLGSVRALGSDDLAQFGRAVHPCQYLPSSPEAGRRADKAAGRAAPVHGI